MARLLYYVLCQLLDVGYAHYEHYFLNVVNIDRNEWVTIRTVPPCLPPPNPRMPRRLSRNGRDALFVAPTYKLNPPCLPAVFSPLSGALLGGDRQKFVRFSSAGGRKITEYMPGEAKPDRTAGSIEML